MSNYTTVQRGDEARQVLDNQAYKDAMASLQSEVIEAWKKCPVRDTEGQVLLLQLVKLTDKFETILNGMVEGGKFAQHQIDIEKLRNESAAKKLMRKIL